MIYPGLPVPVERQPGIVQRRYDIAPDIPDVAGAVVHGFQNVLDVRNVLFTTSRGTSSPFNRIAGLVEQIASTIMLISSLMISALPDYPGISGALLPYSSDIFHLVSPTSISLISLLAYYFGLSAKKLSEAQLRALSDIQRSEKYRSMTVYALHNEKAFSGLGFSSGYYCARQFGSSYMTGVVRDLRNALSEKGMTLEEADDLIFCGGLEIYTPLDRAAQEVIDGEITNVPTDEEFQLAMQIMDYSGNVTACTGGIDKGDRIDHTRKFLSPGSAVKPLSVYAPLEGTEVFGKTGTTDVNGVIDNNWFVGGTPYRVAATCAGLDDPVQNNGMPACTRLWKLIMGKLDVTTTEFTPCGDCISAEFCTKTGLLSSDGCRSTEEGWYTSDNIPEECEVFMNRVLKKAASRQ